MKKVIYSCQVKSLSGSRLLANLTNIKDADRYTPDIWASMGFEPRITGRNLSTEMLD
jgi:hypothetical protein